MRMYADPTRTWATPHSTQKGFVLHDTQEPRYLNGDHSLCNNQMSHPGPASVFPASSALFNQTQATSASPQHRNTVSVPCDFILFFKSTFFTHLLMIQIARTREDYIISTIIPFYHTHSLVTNLFIFILNNFSAYNAHTHVIVSIYYERQKDGRDWMLHPQQRLLCEWKVIAKRSRCVRRPSARFGHFNTKDWPRASTYMHGNQLMM